ncbi:hypothetical protein ACFQFR_14725 [Streptomyces goshikiensis]
MLDLFDGAGQDDGGRGAGGAEAGHVGGVGGGDLRVGQQGLGREPFEQARAEQVVGRGAGGVYGAGVADGARGIADAGDVVDVGERR